MTREQWDVFYPLAHWDIIVQESKARNLDPYQVAGLIRQETVFITRARSVGQCLRTDAGAGADGQTDGAKIWRESRDHCRIALRAAVEYSTRARRICAIRSTSLDASNTSPRLTTPDRDARSSGKLRCRRRSMSGPKRFRSKRRAGTFRASSETGCSTCGFTMERETSSRKSDRALSRRDPNVRKRRVTGGGVKNSHRSRGL